MLLLTNVFFCSPGPQVHGGEEVRIRIPEEDHSFPDAAIEEEKKKKNIFFLSRIPYPSGDKYIDDTAAAIFFRLSIKYQFLLCVKLCCVLRVCCTNNLLFPFHRKFFQTLRL